MVAVIKPIGVCTRVRARSRARVCAGGYTGGRKREERGRGEKTRNELGAIRIASNAPVLFR